MSNPPAAPETPPDSRLRISLKQLIEAADWGADALAGLEPSERLEQAHRVLHGLSKLSSQGVFLQVPHIVTMEPNGAMGTHLHGATLYLSAEGSRLHVAVVEYDSSYLSTVPPALLP